MSPSLEPSAGRIHVVRWIRADGRDAKHRYFRRTARGHRRNPRRVGDFRIKLHTQPCG